MGTLCTGKEVQSEAEAILTEVPADGCRANEDLRKSRGSTPESRRFWRDGIYDQIREMMSLQGSLSIEHMCELARVSRASFYRSLREQRPVEEEMEVRSAIQQIALGHRHRYGYRRITAELRRRGMPVNHKRVLRIMREDNLLAVQPRSFVVTTDSDHGFEVHLNLAGRMKLTGINQLWVADITYIRLKAEFVYLAVILDGHSRKVVGWALERTLASRLAVAAIEQAIAKRQPLPGLVHHSDRGVQYACAEYMAILKKHRMIPSMSRPANPYDNASCESFIKTLETGGNLRPPIRQPGTSAGEHRRIHRGVLQSTAVALRVGLPVSGGVRTAKRVSQPGPRFPECNHTVF